MNYRRHSIPSIKRGTSENANHRLPIIVKQEDRGLLCLLTHGYGRVWHRDMKIRKKEKEKERTEIKGKSRRNRRFQARNGGFGVLSGICSM
jgi:hypothetical protein